MHILYIYIYIYGIGNNNGPSRLISMSSDSPHLTIYEYVPLYATNFCRF